MLLCTTVISTKYEVRTIFGVTQNNIQPASIGVSVLVG